MFIATLFMTAKHGTQPSCPSTGEWLSKWWYIHATEYRSAAKRNKLLLHATSWRNHKGTTLSEKSQSQRLCTTYLVPCTKHSWNNKLQRESLVAARVQGGREQGKWLRLWKCKTRDPSSQGFFSVLTVVVIIQNYRCDRMNNIQRQRLQVKLVKLQ